MSYLATALGVGFDAESRVIRISLDSRWSLPRTIGAGKDIRRLSGPGAPV